jgi:4-alpha-glucanotransferase
MSELKDLAALARAMGVHARYTDGLDRPVSVQPETLVRVCAALGAPVAGPGDAGDGLRALDAAGNARSFLPPVIVAWDGVLPRLAILEAGPVHAELALEEGDVAPLERRGAELGVTHPLPLGYHLLTVEAPEGTRSCTVIAAPVEAWRRPGSQRSWGIGGQLAAFRSARSRCLGDLRDLESVGRWVGERGGDLVMVLPLLPTFNTEPPEPSPYSPVSRLFWSELMLDLDSAHRPAQPVSTLDVTRADAEVRAALAALPFPDASRVDDELLRYARFRGAQARLGRNWRDWPARARAGALSSEQIDPDEVRFHLVAQTLARRQLGDLRRRLEDSGVRLGMDLAVGVHADGYDPWSRQPLFAEKMSVGAPPDMGFPSGQDWGFPPVLPAASRLEGHRYLAKSIAHQAAVSGVLRVDHIMAWTRLYWIPQGLRKDEGTYVSYPAEELFAILTLESNRARCEVVGENLGTVPLEIDQALPRHRIRGMYLAQFQAEKDPAVAAPTAADMALVNTHDTPTFAGWLAGVDIDERIRCGLLTADEVPAVREIRSCATRRLAERMGRSVDEPEPFLLEVLEWLGRSASPLVVPWLEDLWLEDEGVNLPATLSSERPNWQRPMRKLLDEVFADPEIRERIRRLHQARNPA